MSKFDGIDERVIKCSDKAPGTIQAGISFDKLENGQNVLRYHFLAIPFLNGKVTQITRSMYLNKENTAQLIKELQELTFEN